MIRRPQNRRGVVILIVLSLLVLFVLLVVTFAIVAGQYLRAAQAVGRREWLGEDPQRIADRVMYALVREPDLDHAGSPLRGHSLLADVYGMPVSRLSTASYLRRPGDTGNQTMRGEVNATTTPVALAGAQIVQFTFTPKWTPGYSDLLTGFYNGSVLTFIDGPLQGQSTRVVWYQYDAATSAYWLRIVTPQLDGTGTALPAVGNTFVLNGKPFAGTGFGYNSTAGSATPRLTEEALKPNRIGQAVYDTSDPTNSLFHFVNGGPNESYDAVDYQNMIMAAVVYDPANPSAPPRVLPSFHRPELIRYWMDRVPDSWDALANPGDVPAKWDHLTNEYYRDFRRKVIFRPMPWDHPNFSGSNPALDPALCSADQIKNALLDYNSWDIDNDGDGTKDSIWIDPDLPVQTTEDGRAFKTLVAVLCIDMDGRLNVNAHGNRAHTATLATHVSMPLPGDTGPTTSADLPKGQGYGPPEVNLLPLFPVATQYQTLLQSRYGADGVPGAAGYDLLMPFKQYEYPGNYFSANFYANTYFNRTVSPATPFQAVGAFNSNMDLHGVFACGVDYRGQPLYELLYDSSTTPGTYPDQLADNPYEFNLHSPSAADAPFTVAELEKVLRYRDYDAALRRSRLTDSTSLTFLQSDPSRRAAVTTDSWDIPVPGVVVPDGYPNHTAPPPPLPMSTPPQSIMEILADRLLAGGVTIANINTEIGEMLSPDLRMGLRLDVNRPLGNGRDDNGNGVVDEAYGVGIFANLNESLGPEYAKNGNVNIMGIDHDNDGALTNDPDAHLARSYLARHLYVLAMLLKDRTFYYDLDGDGNATAAETAQVVAQWAVNVVDFRDADSIMTPFEYDVDPFNGWDVDGILDSADDGVADRRVVWGCERPELLISETLAFHDRRTEDLEPKTTDHDDPDLDFDQRLAPRGALFVELYNPWAGHDKWPGEFYHTGSAWSSGVLLNKTNASGQPVWRLAVTGSTEPDSLDPHPTTSAIPDPERTVYFVNPASLSGSVGVGTQMHFSTVTGLAPLLPGRYAVVGTAGMVDGSSYVTTIGRRTDAGDTQAEPAGTLTLNLAGTRQIRLTPSNNPAVNQVEVRNNTAPPATGDPATVDPPMDSFSSTAQVQPAIAVPINTVLSTGTSKGKGKGKGKGGAGTDDIWLSISEPIGGYDDPGPNGEVWYPEAADGEGAYVPHIPVPLDRDNASLPKIDGDESNGTARNHKRIHLQRLANPLAPYDDVTNPYLTIDVMPVDLTIFNGVSATPDPSITEKLNRFGCFQRGANDAATERYLWPHEPETFVLDEPAPDALHHFDSILRHTLGYLNSSYGTRFDLSTTPAAPPFAVTTYLGSPSTSTTEPAFPWLTWNNRPYASPTELLLVPRSRASRLLKDFTIENTTTCRYLPNPDDGDDTNGKEGVFRHLLNFFATDPNANNAPHFYRLFEYLTVRSRFAGAETLFNPSTASPHFGSTASGTEMLHPPFNWVSTYREPGRINLNTIFDFRVWNGLWGNHRTDPDHPFTFPDFVDNRRGYSATAGQILFDPPTPATNPTYFGNPYRAPGTAMLVPPDSSGGTGLGRLEVDNTLLRTNKPTMGITAPTNEVPRYLNVFGELRRHTDRNAHFSYQALQRLSNLVTCRSNVYALWLTIGYFEVDPATLQLGQEVGLDTGTVQRHRAFYIIDRSIPVAFEPGQNHNVDKCVLLRRMIE